MQQYVRELASMRPKNDRDRMTCNGHRIRNDSVQRRSATDVHELFRLTEAGRSAGRENHDVDGSGHGAF